MRDKKQKKAKEPEKKLRISCIACNHVIEHDSTSPDGKGCYSKYTSLHGNKYKIVCEKCGTDFSYNEVVDRYYYTRDFCLDLEF